MRRIAWLHSHFLHWAGGTKFVYEVARRVHRVVPVDMIVERCSEKVAGLFAAEGMKVIELSDRSSTSMAYWAAFPLYLSRDIRRLRKLLPSYSGVVSSMFPMNYAAGAAGAPRHLTYVLEPFAFFHDEDMIRGFPAHKRPLLRLLSACYRHLDVRGVTSADAVLTINAGTARWVREVYGRELTTTLLGVDADFFRPTDRLAQRYAGRAVVVHSTDFTPLKRTAEALEIVARVRGAVPNVKLLITSSFVDPRGVARLTRQVRSLGLEDHVEFVGFVPFEDLPAMYALAYASLYTGIGRGASAASLFVLESMACGTPGVRTNFTDDEIEHGVSGFLYPPEDREAAQRYLTQILTDDALRLRFGEAARQRVVTRYKWDSVAERMTLALTSLPGAVPSAPSVNEP